MLARLGFDSPTPPVIFTNDDCVYKSADIEDLKVSPKYVCMCVGSHDNIHLV